jgi:dienelactone hydrolase
LRSRADIDRKKMMLAGQSAGGYSAMYLASTNPEGVIGAINFSGGRTDMNAFGAGFLNRTMVQGFAEFGRSTRIPTLWIFAENDSRYSANTIRASHEAFVAAGGKAQLFLNTAIAGDGHFIYQRPELWRGALRSYLEEIGVVQRSPTQKDQPAASSPVR